MFLIYSTNPSLFVPLNFDIKSLFEINELSENISSHTVPSYRNIGFSILLGTSIFYDFSLKEQLLLTDFCENELTESKNFYSWEKVL